MAPRQNELKLYMEVADKLINGKTWSYVEVNWNMNIIVFLKGLGYLYVQEFAKVEDYTHEIKPDMIEKMYPNYTFKRPEIQNGDIICFQKGFNGK
ncbi:hypothetical protein C1646_750623 [Rhizophagus diaphanus]|nr:hypothetical protein C1646_750623 [Rhizophagus diaphanus] [Rhizophagus sp. MUCL 43196]